MRALLFVSIALFACDHRPAPPKQDPENAPVKLPTSTPDAAGAAVPVPQGDDACVQIGARVAEIIISATTDPTQKAAYEQERTKLVRRFSENCTKENWSEATRRCFMNAKTPQDVEVCSRDLAKTQPPAAPAAGAGSAGSGSAKPSTRD